MGGGELQSSLTSLTMARGGSRDSVDGGRRASVITDKPYYGCKMMNNKTINFQYQYIFCCVVYICMSDKKYPQQFHAYQQI
jgi:hypothetical protein